MNQRSCGEPFYLVTGEINDGLFDLDSEIPETFDDLDAAKAYVDAQHAEYGVGMVVFYCEPRFRVPSDESKVPADD
jgi:hypothetical protein